MSNAEISRLIKIAVAQSNQYTDQKMADHVRGNMIGGAWMAIALVIFQAVLNTAIAIAVLS
jgi:hypothetical protein